jgi:hypothetical protein
VGRVGWVDTACGEEVHCSRESDETGEKEGRAGFHSYPPSGEDEAVFAAFVGDSGGSKPRPYIPNANEVLNFQEIHANLIAAGKVIVIPSPTAEPCNATIVGFRHL